MIVHQIALYLLVAFIAATFLESFLKISRNAHRNLYWFLTACAAACGFLVAYPNIKEAILAVVFVIGGLASAAYFNTPYIKVGGKIYADLVSDSQPDREDETPEKRAPGNDPAPDSYSGMYTPAKFWWGMVPVGVIASGIVALGVSGQKPLWYAGIGIALIIAMALFGGYGDGSWGYQIARGQYIPFALTCLVTAGVFAAFYLPAYYAGKQWPTRRKQSMEYRAHPRHQQH